MYTCLISTDLDVMREACPLLAHFMAMKMEPGSGDDARPEGGRPSGDGPEYLEELMEILSAMRPEEAMEHSGERPSGDDRGM